MDNIIKALEEKNLEVFSFLIQNHNQDQKEDFEKIFMFFNDKDEEYGSFFKALLVKYSYNDLLKNTEFNNDKFSNYFPFEITLETKKIFFQRKMFKSFKRYILPEDKYEFDYDKDKVEFSLYNNMFMKEEYFIKYVTEDLWKEDLTTKGEIIEKVREFLLKNESIDHEAKLKRKICELLFFEGDKENLLFKILEDRPLYNSDIIYHNRKDRKVWKINIKDFKSDSCNKKSSFEEDVKTYKELDDQYNTDIFFKNIYLQGVIENNNEVILKYIVDNNLIDINFLINEICDMEKEKLFEKLDIKISEEEFKQIFNNDPKIDLFLNLYKNQYKKNVKVFHGYKFDVLWFNACINRTVINGKCYYFQKVETCNEEQMKLLLLALSIQTDTNHLLPDGPKIFVKDQDVYYGCINKLCKIKNIEKITKDDPIIEIL